MREKPVLKVGDRVKLREDYAFVVGGKGVTGRIVEVDDDPDYPYRFVTEDSEENRAILGPLHHRIGVSFCVSRFAAEDPFILYCKEALRDTENR